MRVFEFHALRHQFISVLAAAGVYSNTAQELARHSSITLTVDHSTHLRLSGLTTALESVLPGVVAQRLAAVATRTDCESPVALEADNSGNSVRPNETTEGIQPARRRTLSAQQKTPALTGVENDCDQS